MGMMFHPHAGAAEKFLQEAQGQITVGCRHRRQQLGRHSGDVVLGKCGSVRGNDSLCG